MNSKITKIVGAVVVAITLTGCSFSLNKAPEINSTIQTKQSYQSNSAPTNRNSITEKNETSIKSSSEIGTTRENPLNIGGSISNDDWTFTLNSVDLSATSKIMKENMFNNKPKVGNTYIMANVTYKYMGNDPQGDTPMGTVAFVTADGKTINSYDSLVVAPDDLESLTTLYTGGEATGNIALEVPEKNITEGTLAVRIDFLSDKVFFSVK